MSFLITERVPLASMTTLKCGGSAEYFAEVTSTKALEEACAFAVEKNLPITILGGGSNVLVSDAGVRGLVIRPRFTDITYEENGTDVYVHAGAGVVLDALVHDTVEKGLWGLENLSGIPGSVGAVPMQNVGAYGVEARDVVHEVTVYNRETGQTETLSNEACVFSYRYSHFKTEAGKRYIIVGVTFKLSVLPSPRVAYKDLASRFGEVENPKLEDIRDAVITIREGKFPDWHVVGTAGSFFKNPVVSPRVYTALQTQFPLVPGFAEQNGVKIPLGWILDHVLNLKGYREGNVGLYEKQALVLVKYGEATSDEVLRFAEKIREQVSDATGIQVAFEVVYLA